MNRRLKKLIEQKAWETLTDYGYNDAHLLEQLTESVLERLSEQVPGGPPPLGPNPGDLPPEGVDPFGQGYDDQGYIYYVYRGSDGFLYYIYKGVSHKVGTGPLAGKGLRGMPELSNSDSPMAREIRRNISQRKTPLRWDQERPGRLLNNIQGMGGINRGLSL